MSAKHEDTVNSVLFDSTIASVEHDHVIKDLSEAAFGRKELEIAETEMPGLVEIRDEFRADQPLKGAKIAG